MISEEDIDRRASAARLLAPSASTYLEEDFVMNLLETVLDDMLQTEGNYGATTVRGQRPRDAFA